MGRSLTQKLIEAHLVAGKSVAGEEVGISIDQVLLTDTNGTMALLQFEAMGRTRMVPPRVVAYVDHNVYQVDTRLLTCPCADYQKHLQACKHILAAEIHTGALGLAGRAEEPLNPPAPISSNLEPAVTNPSRLMVVFVATSPSNFISSANPITSSSCCWLRSGAIFSNNGLGRTPFCTASSPLIRCRFVNILCKASFS